MKAPLRFAPTRASQIVTAGLIGFAAAVWLYRLITRLRLFLTFDDSYMFYRYAMHIRQGLGVSWNLDRVHTYGETSPLWGGAVLLLSYLPLSMSKALILGPWVCSIGAILAISWAVARNAESEYMSSLWRVLPIVAVPFVFMRVFILNALTGMETMLATLLGALFVGLSLGWSKSKVQPEIVGIVGALLFLTRPEAALAVCSTAILAYLFVPGVTLKSAARLLGVFLLCFAADLLVSRTYFGTPLPLSFYMKSRHSYDGFFVSQHPSLFAYLFLRTCSPYLALLAIFSRGLDWRRAAVCVVPACLTIAYLCTITQIMGYDSRYYAPYLAFFVVPGFLALDRRLFLSAAGERFLQPVSRQTAIAWAIVLACLIAIDAKKESLFRALDRKLEAREFVYDPVHFQVLAAGRLPELTWFSTVKDLSDLVIAPLPKGATVTASEVGYLGARAPQVNVIDLSGLNDPPIALHGFDTDALLARKPDIIWLPHTDYTYQRGLLLSNPRLLKEYDVLMGAANYGLALRKDSSLRPEIDRGMQALWKKLYPGYNMSDYQVQSVSWTGRKHRVTTTEEQAKQDEKDQIDHATQE